MHDVLSSIQESLDGRLTGPLHLRLYLQPGMALFLGIRDGLKDAKEHQPAYFWSIFTSPGRRTEMIKHGLRSVAKLLILAIVLDLIYQAIVSHWVFPVEALIVALLLAFVPYLLIRGPTNRIASWWKQRQQQRMATR
jgi:hypothetical protein